MYESIAAVGEDQRPDLHTQKPGFVHLEQQNMKDLYRNLLKIWNLRFDKSDIVFWCYSASLMHSMRINWVNQIFEHLVAAKHAFCLKMVLRMIKKLVFDREDLVSDLLQQRQSIRTHEKGPTWNLQVPSMPLKKVIFFCAFEARIPKARGEARI